MIQSNIIWTAIEASKVLGLEPQSNWSATGVSIDSRTVEQGDLFIALEGDTGNGHDYVAQALKKGASAAIVSQKIEGVDEKNLLIVEDTLTALQSLARAARKRTSAKIFAITGSVGKTGTKELLHAALSAYGQTHASVKSYNNHWGVPLSLARMHAGTDYGIFEIGMNHSGEITPLSKMVKPDISIITTIAPVHIENFDDGIKGIAHAKSEIFGGMENGSIAILNNDHDYFDILKTNANKRGLKICSYGDNKDADTQLVKIIEAANGSRVEANIIGEHIKYSLQIAGRHIAINCLSILSAIKISGLDLDKAVNVLSRQEPVSGRGKREFLDIGQAANPVTLIDESYNASPTAMQAAFKVLALIDPGRGGRRIAVLGDMLELGKDSDNMHSDLALPLKAANVDLVYTCGKKMRKLYDNLPANQRGAHKDSSRELAQIVPDVLIPGDVVMVKGSLGSKMSLVVEALRALPLKFKQATEGQI